MEQTKTRRRCSPRTKELPEWETAILKITPFQTIRLLADGYNLSIQWQLSKNKVVLCWFVDNVWKGEYLSPQSEIGRKFGRAKKITYPRNFYKIERLLNGKKAADKKKQEFEVRIHGYLNYWYSAKALVSHLRKTCQKIECHEP